MAYSQVPGVDVWMAPPLSQAENPALHNAVGMADELASVHLNLDKGTATLINDADPTIHIYRDGHPNKTMDGGPFGRYPLPNRRLGSMEHQRMDPAVRELMKSRMTYTNP